MVNKDVYIFIKFGKDVPVVELINFDKFWYNLFKGFDFTVGQTFHFPTGKQSRRYISHILAYMFSRNSTLQKMAPNSP